MSTIGFQILVLVLLVLAGGFFAMAEIAVVSARKVRLRQRAEEGHKGAAVALQLAADPNRFFSTVQVGITLIGTLAGVFGGAALAEPLGAWLARFPRLAPFAQPLGFGVVVVLIAYLSLVLGELAPKRLALAYAESIAEATAPLMRFLGRLAYPAERLLTYSTRFVFRVIGIKPPAETPITEEEIKGLIRMGAAAGVIEPAEKEMAINVFRLADRRVKTVMTPRTDLVWIDLDEPEAESWRKMRESGFTYFPAYRGRPDQMLGLLSVKDLWGRMINGQDVNRETALIQPLLLHENLPALKALEYFRQADVRVALVVDEFGGIQGLVTQNDLLETLVGDVRSGSGPEEPPAIQREDGSWLLDGLLPVDELKHRLGLKDLPEEDRGYHTVGGLMMSAMGRIPRATDHFLYEGWRFEILDMDGRRVDKILVRKEEPPPPTEED